MEKGTLSNAAKACLFYEDNGGLDIHSLRKDFNLSRYHTFRSYLIALFRAEGFSRYIAGKIADHFGV